jgi:hypothetical protein
MELTRRQIVLDLLWFLLVVALFAGMIGGAAMFIEWLEQVEAGASQ